MKTMFSMLLATISFWAAAQDTAVVQLEYFIDTDPGAGNATRVNIPPGEDVNFPFTINLSGYAPGYHRLYIRSRDSVGNWSLTARRNVEVVPLSLKTNVVGGEYFIDEDPGFGAATPINIASPDTAMLQDFLAATNGLAPGYHKLYGRLKDVLGNWSLVFRRNIQVVQAGNNQLVHGEYFFRTDNGFNNATPVEFTTPSADGSFTFTIPNNQIPVNADTLFLRVTDDIERNWSLTTWSDSLFNGALPLTLLGFDGSRHGELVELTWQTTNEINTNYFDIQRSRDGINFSDVGRVKATNRAGMVNHYSYEDNIAGILYNPVYYRLRQVDLDATARLSKVVSIAIGGSIKGLKIAPNPARGHLNISSEKPEDLKGAVVTIVDMSGRTCLTRQLSAVATQQINISNLVRGVYMIGLVSSTGIQSEKLLVE